MTDKELIDLAKNAAHNSYSPYSKFKVGAALLCSDGTVYTGCNVENISFGATNCAERTAVFKAVSEGKREFSKIAVTGSGDGSFSEFTYPCGVCRQVLSEFCKGNFSVVLSNGKEIKSIPFSEFMPFPFDDF